MQLPTMKTPVRKCLELAAYSVRMLGKFPERPRLFECARRLDDRRSQLKEAQAAYEEMSELALVSRVDASFENYLSDREIGGLQRKTEIADGRRGGPISSVVFPNGARNITRLQGRSQIQAMRGVEVRLEGAKDMWPEASEEKLSVEQHRENYEAAIEARDAAKRTIDSLRTRRDAAKRRFLDTYAEIANLVQAEFPRNKAMHELFFDQVQVRRQGRTSDEEFSEMPAPSDTGDTPVNDQTA